MQAADPGHADGRPGRADPAQPPAVTLETLPVRAAATARRRPDTNVIVAVDSAAPSGIVVQAMLQAREAGAEHFLFAVAPK